MRRSCVLGGIVAVWAASVAAAGLGQAQAPNVAAIAQVKDNLYVMKGGGGNTAVFVTADGVVVVDTKLPGWGQPILDEMGPSPTSRSPMIINTHTHGDHVSGNVEFPGDRRRRGAGEHRGEHASRWRRRRAASRGRSNIFAEHGGGCRRARSTTGDARCGRRRDRPATTSAAPTPAATPGSCSRRCARCTPATRSPARTLPIIDANNGGSGVDFADTLTKAAAGIPDVDTIITGHDGNDDDGRPEEYTPLQPGLPRLRRARLEAGKSVEASTAAYRLPAKYTGYQAQDARVKSNVPAISDELKK